MRRSSLFVWKGRMDISSTGSGMANYGGQIACYDSGGEIIDKGVSERQRPCKLVALS
jgi:hypothetical protein